MAVIRVNERHAPSVINRSGKYGYPTVTVIMNPYFQPSRKLKEIATGGRTTGDFPYLKRKRTYLKLGSKGLAVSLVQWGLAYLGDARLVADGKFGPQTKRAVESFQRKRRLGVDGVVGPNTLGVLNEAMNFRVRQMS